MPKAIWQGHITFGLVAIPVSLVSAQDAEAALSFRQIDRRTSSPVHLKRVNDAGDEVPWEEIVKGYELENGDYVSLTPEDFERANVKATRTIEIFEAVCADEIDPAFFVKPYYLVPSADSASKPYALLREGLARQGRAAVARIVVRTREHVCVVYPKGQALVLVVLRYPYELRDTTGLDLPGEIDEMGVTEKEMDLAEQLVSSLAADWDPSAFTDSYRNDLLALIAKKRKAGESYSPEPLPARDDGAEVVDLMALLKDSLTQGKRSAGGKAAG